MAELAVGVQQLQAWLEAAAAEAAEVAAAEAEEPGADGAAGASQWGSEFRELESGIAALLARQAEVQQQLQAAVGAAGGAKGEAAGKARALWEYQQLAEPGEHSHSHGDGGLSCDRCLQPIDQALFSSNVERLRAAAQRAQQDEAAAAAAVAALRTQAAEADRLAEAARRRQMAAVQAEAAARQSADAARQAARQAAAERETHRRSLEKLALEAEQCCRLIDEALQGLLLRGPAAADEEMADMAVAAGGGARSRKRPAALALSAALPGAPCTSAELSAVAARVQSALGSAPGLLRRGHDLTSKRSNQRQEVNPYASDVQRLAGMAEGSEAELARLGQLEDELGEQASTYKLVRVCRGDGRLEPGWRN